MNKNVKIGFEVEFFSKVSLEKLHESLERNLKKRIKYFNEGHADFQVTEDIWKLERDYSGGAEMYELVTFHKSYDEALYYMDKIFNLIKRIGYTTDRCAFQINISLNDKTVMARLDKLKLALLLDEEKIYSDFPERKDHLYCKSIKHIIPLTNHYRDTDNLDPANFTIPESKYYGVDFTKLKKGYLEFRYFGGEKYEYKQDLFWAYIDEFIKLMARSANGTFGQTEKAKLKKYLKTKQRVLEAYKSYNNFRYAYPNIQIWVNLVNTPSFIETHYHMIKDKIFKIMTEANLQKGIINYNSDYSSIEIKDGEFGNIYQLDTIVLINCKLKGELINCRIFESEVENAHLMGCHIYQETDIKDSKLNDCYVSTECTLFNCYIAGGRYSIIRSQLTGGIFRSGQITKVAYKNAVDVEFIEYKYI